MSAPALSLIPKRMSLWEHVQDVDAIADLVFALDDAGSMTPEAEEQLQHALIRANAGTKAKVDRTASVLASFEAAEAFASAEAERLAKRAATFRRSRERLTDYVLATLDASKLDKLEGDTSTLARRKNPAKVIVDDETAIPIDFLRFPDEPPPPPPVPDKAAIAKALKLDPASVPGARLVQTFRLVRS